VGLQSREAGHKGSGMEPSERALVSLNRFSMQIIPIPTLMCPSFGRGVGACFSSIFGGGRVANPNLGEEDAVKP